MARGARERSVQDAREANPQAAARAELLALLQPGAEAVDPARVRALIETLERSQPADLSRDRDLLTGVWELRWSSSRSSIF